MEAAITAPEERHRCNASRWPAQHRSKAQDLLAWWSVRRAGSGRDGGGGSGSAGRGATENRSDSHHRRCTRRAAGFRVPQHGSGLGTRPGPRLEGEAVLQRIGGAAGFRRIVACWTCTRGSRGALGPRSSFAWCDSSGCLSRPISARPRVIAENIASLGVRTGGACAGAVSTRCWPAVPRGRWIWSSPTRRMTSTTLRSMRCSRGWSMARWVAVGSVVLVERRASSGPVNWPEGWDALSARRYGDTRVELAEVG